MKILLINPTGTTRAAEDPANSMYPFSLLFLSGFLYKNGYKAEIFDVATSEYPVEDVETFLKGKRYDIVGVTSTPESRFISEDIIDNVRKSMPLAKIVVGGFFYTYTPEQTLNSIPAVDVVVVGEGEWPLLHLVKAWENGGDISGIEGISFRKDNKIVNNPEGEPEQDMDKFEIPDEVLDYVYLAKGKYSPYMIFRNFENEGTKALSIQIGRGCPYKCVYCILASRKYRSRSVESLLQEVKRKAAKYDCNVFHFDDSLLSHRKKFLREFCTRVIDEGIDIKWYCESRADMDLELLAFMRKAGCISIDFALESASERVLSSIKKKLTIQQVENMIEKCNELDIHIRVFSMISLPDETEEDSWKTYNFLRENRHRISSLDGAGSITQIIPGTALEDMAVERGVLSKDFDWYDRSYRHPLSDKLGTNVPIWKEHLSYEFMEQMSNKVSVLQKSRVGSSLMARRFKEQIYAFLLDWSRPALALKKRCIAYTFKYFYAKLLFR